MQAELMMLTGYECEIKHIYDARLCPALGEIYLADYRNIGCETATNQDYKLQTNFQLRDEP